MLTKVILTNYRQFTSKEVELNNALHIIQGRNATGKSTVVEAIAYALQGSSVQKGKGTSWVKDGEQHGGVDLYLDDIVISRHTNKQVVLNSDGDIIARGHTGINEYIEGRYKLVPELFKTSFYIGQKDIDSFAGLTSLERTKRVEKLLRIDILDDIKKDVADKSKLVKADVASINNKLSSAAFDPAKLSSLEATVAKLEASYEDSKAKLTALEREDAVYQEALAKWQKKIYWHARLDGRPREDLEAAIVSIEAELVKAHKADEINRLVDEKLSLEKKLEGVTINESYFKWSITQIMDHKLIVESNKKVLKQLEDFDGVLEVEHKDLSDLYENLMATKHDLATLKKSPEVCTTCGQKMPDAKIRNTKLKELETKAAELTATYETKKREHDCFVLKSKLQPEILELEASVEEVLKVLEAKPYYERIKEIGNVEHIPGQSVEALQRLLKIAQEGINSLNVYAEYESIESEPIKVDLVSARQNVQGTINMLKSFKEDLASQQSAKQVHDMYSAELVEKENKVLTYSKLIKFIDTYRKQFSDNVIPLLSDNVTKIMSYLTEGKYDKISIAQDYSIENYDMLSGSEEDSVNFALRIAIAQISRLGDFNTMMLDEIAASFDSVKEGLLLDILKSTNMQLIYISHGQLDS